MAGFRDGEFVTQYAIRTPIGELFQAPRSAMSSVYGFDSPTEPAIWDTHEDAERALHYLRAEADRLGVHNWLGTIVQRICSPFTTDDPGQHFAADLEEWLRHQ